MIGVGYGGRQVDILSLTFPRESLRKLLTILAEETPFYLFVNTTFWATILCSPTDLQEWQLGIFL